MNSPDEPNHSSLGSKQLTPPGTAAEKADGNRRQQLFVVVGFLVLFAGLLTVLFFLPVKKDAGLPASEELQGSQAEAEVERVDSPAEQFQAAAVAARERFLALQIESDSENIGQWGGTEYRDIEAMFAEADGLLQSGSFSEAAALYQGATAALQALTETKGQRLGAALLEGQRLLSEEKIAEAEIQFRLALLIEPSSEEARAGLERAESAAAAMAHYQRAMSLEENNNLEEAAVQLRAALEIDDRYEPARVRLQNIEARISESQFTVEMNALLAALDRQDFTSAGGSLERLKKLGIRNEQVSRVEALLAEKKQLAEVDSLRTQAAAFEGGEQWQQALERYERILLVAPDALFAVAGRDRAARRVQLDRALGEAIDRPQRLQDPKQRAAARQLLAHAEQFEPSGPRLDSRIEALHNLLKAAETPVTVTLESDNQTDVTIYHVGRFGAFYSHRLALEPGTYTVVGSKPGYRDVRKEMTITPGGGAYRLDIRCEEPI